MESIEVTGDLSRLDAAIEALPNIPAVFLLWPESGEPYLSKTTLLRRRLLRLLRERDKPSRLLNLRHTVRRIDYHFTASSLESAAVFYDQARCHFPDTYLDLMKLRMPPYVKLILNNQFPRTQITTHLTRTSNATLLGRTDAPALYFGPFRSRASAEKFEAQFLDLFQIRRCQEDLVPSPDHPGCIYGEMAMCLRPCQEVVGAQEYGHEVARVVQFLHTGGHSLLDAVAASRDRLSQEMAFEEAARQHKRFEKVQDVLRLRDELVSDIDRLHGVALTRSLAQDSVELWFVRGGIWCQPIRFGFEIQEGKPVSLDRKLRDLLPSVAELKLSVRERQEYLALLSRWYYSTWCDGEWLPFESFDQIPYRKLVNAICRIARP
jgi:excinuclease UvrABC nuclease subunit